EAFQIGIYWAHTNTVHKSKALKLVHDLTSPRWKEGTSSVVVTLDEEGYVEVDIALGAYPGKQKVCQFCVSSVVRHGVQILQIEDRTILVNNTPYSIHYRPLLTNHVLGGREQVCEMPEGTVFTLPPSEDSSLAKPCSVPCWDLLQTSVQGKVEFPLPVRHMIFSLFLRPDAGVGTTAWSVPTPVRPDLPRQSLSIPVDQVSGGGLSSRQREQLPTLQLKTMSDNSTTNWTDPIDINCPGTQLSYPKSSKLSVRILLSEASVALSDDITNPSGSMELLRLTLTKLLLSLVPAPISLPPELAEDSTMASSSFCVLMTDASLIEIYCYSLQVDNQLYNRTTAVTVSFRLVISVQISDVAGLRNSFVYILPQVSFQLQPARVYIEDTFVYYIKTLFDTYIPSRPGESKRGREPGAALVLPAQVVDSVQALVHPVRLQKLTIQPVHLLVSIHASLKLYIASDHTPLSFSVFERGPLFTTARQLVHALAMHYAAGALFRAGRFQIK
ncbi:hypothetical protein GOODEAATRI_015072, partial [Goodea atripinnis]